MWPNNSHRVQSNDPAVADQSRSASVSVAIADPTTASPSDGPSGCVIPVIVARHRRSALPSLRKLFVIQQVRWCRRRRRALPPAHRAQELPVHDMAIRCRHRAAAAGRIVGRSGCAGQCGRRGRSGHGPIRRDVGARRRGRLQRLTDATTPACQGKPALSRCSI